MKNYHLLPTKWIDYLSSKPETGMGYHVATIKLKDGRIFDRVVINGGYVTKIWGLSEIPFETDEIVDVKVTHNKWNFTKRRKETEE
nr:hypothetical protein [uncultured bacterium]